MPNTPGWGLPYPAPSDSPNIPAALQALATDLEGKLADLAAGYRVADIVANAATFTALVNLTGTGVQNGLATVTSNRLTAGRAGLYEVAFDCNYSHTAAVQVNMIARLNSGGSVSGGSQVFAAFDGLSSAGGTSTLSGRRKSVNLAVGDYLEFFFTSVAAGTGCTLKGTSVHNEFSLKLLDPA